VKPKSVLVFMGTRPEAIKLAPVVAALRDSPDFHCTVVATGQHKEMFRQVADQFGFPFYLVNAEDDFKRHVVDFHQRVLDAIRRRDGQAAYDEMLRHVHDVQSRLGKAFERQLPEREARK